MDQIENELFYFIANETPKRTLQEKLLRSAHPHHALRYELITFCGFLAAEIALLRVKDVRDKTEVYIPDLRGYENLKSKRLISLSLSPTAMDMIKHMTMALAPEDALFTSILKDGEKVELDHTVFYLALKYHANQMFALDISVETLRLCYLYNELLKTQGNHLSLLKEQRLQNSTLLKKAIKLYEQHNKPTILTDTNSIATEMSASIKNFLDLQQEILFVLNSINDDTKESVRNSLQIIDNEIQKIHVEVHNNIISAKLNSKSPALLNPSSTKRKKKVKNNTNDGG